MARDVEDAPDWIYCPDPDSVPIGLGLGDRLGAKVIFDIHEVYHTTHVGHWLKGNQIPLVNSQIQRVISRYAAAADLAVGVSNGVLEAYCSGLDHGLLLRNCPPAWFAGRTPGQSFSSGSDFRLMHGLIGPNRGTRELITALANHTGSSGSIVLSCFGQDEELNKLVSTGSLEKIRRQGVGFSIDLKQPIPYESMPDHLRTCHAGVVSYTGPMSGPNLANRVFEYMALGLPVLAPLQSPEIVEVVRSAGTGLVYDLDRPESILEAVTKLMTDPGLRSELGGNGRRLFLDEFTWESQFKQLLARLNGPNPRTR